MGSNHIFIGEVMDIRNRRDGQALLYFDRGHAPVLGQAGSFGG